jgi:hypothetical protein
VRRADNPTTFMCRLSRNLGASTSWNPKGPPTPVMGLLYLTNPLLFTAGSRLLNIQVHHLFSGFRRDAEEICLLLGCYAASCGNIPEESRSPIVCYSPHSFTYNIEVGNRPMSSLMMGRQGPKHVAVEYFQIYYEPVTIKYISG